MLRIFTFRCGNLLMKSKLVAWQRDISSFLSLRLYTPSFQVYHFCSGNSAENNDAGEKSKETEAVDLDTWKSVMTSQATFQTQRLELEPSEDVDDLKQTGADSMDGDSLEATRELVSMWRLAGKLVPQQMTEEEIQQVAGLTTKSAKKRHLKYLTIRENHKLKHNKKQQQKRANREAALKEKREMAGEDDDDHRPMAKNTFLLKFWQRSLDRLLNWRAANAMVFGQPLVFDMSYESNMATREMENTATQLMKVEGLNRRAVDPFHLHYCNLQPGGPYEKAMLKHYGEEAWERLLITSTERHYIDLFPREQLVYLTADSPKVLRTFDNSKVYIVGALVDRSPQSGVSLANAKRLKLATARLPLDEFLNWEVGNKNLTLDQMLSILLNIRDTGDWRKALDFVPKRKHDGFYQCDAQTGNRTGGFTSRAWREDRDEDRTFKNQNAYKDFEFVGRKNAPETTRVRASYKNNTEAGTRTNSSRKWWQDE